MARAPEIHFGPFRLAPGELVRGSRRVALQPRPLAVLRYLAERPGQVVSAGELLHEVWGEIFVTRAVLKVAVCAVREALGDEVASPRYIETVGREGYRFVGGAAPFGPGDEGSRESRPLPMVARAAELERQRGRRRSN